MQKKKKRTVQRQGIGEIYGLSHYGRERTRDDFLSLPCIEQVHGHPQPREGAADVRIRPR